MSNCNLADSMVAVRTDPGPMPGFLRTHPPDWFWQESGCAALMRLESAEAFIGRDDDLEHCAVSRHCGAEGSRNPDLFDANEALYQLSYSPIRCPTVAEQQKLTLARALAKRKISQISHQSALALVSSVVAFLRPNFALSRPMTVGRTEMTRIRMMTSSKCCWTAGMPPKK